jgi:regulator of replication initiation timing
MSPVDQLELLPLRKRLQEPVSDEVVRKQPNMSAAINLSITAAGMEPKEAYISLDIDKGVWSRIMMGQAHFPHEKFTTLEDITGNDIPLRWLALRKDREVRPMKTALEKQVEELNAKVDELLKENELLRGLITGKMRP